MKFTNGWKAINKAWDKLTIELRISKLTILEIKWDISDKKYEIILLNVGISNS